MRAEARSLHKRRESGRGLRDIGIRDRQQGAIAPHIQRSLGDGFAGKAGASVLKVEDHLKWEKTVITDGKRLNPVGFPTFPTT